MFNYLKIDRFTEKCVFVDWTGLNQVYTEQLLNLLNGIFDIDFV